DSKQVVTTLGAMLKGLVQEEPGIETLALEPSLQVDDGDDHGIDAAVVDRGSECIDAQWRSSHAVSLPQRFPLSAPRRARAPANASSRAIRVPRSSAIARLEP